MIDVLLALLVLSGDASPTQPRAPRATVSGPDRAAAGMMLARLTYPDAMNRAVVDYTVTCVVGPGYRADPRTSALDDEHPGIIDAMLAAMRPELARGRSEALPTLWREMGAAYANRLDADELGDAIAFQQGSVGRPMTDAQVRMILTTVRGAGQACRAGGAAPKQTNADIAATDSFYGGKAGRKLLALHAEIGSINAAWNKRPDPVTDARIQTALDKVMKRFWHGEAAR